MAYSADCANGVPTRFTCSRNPAQRRVLPPKTVRPAVLATKAGLGRPGRRDGWPPGSEVRGPRSLRSARCRFTSGRRKPQESGSARLSTTASSHDGCCPLARPVITWIVPRCAGRVGVQRHSCGSILVNADALMPSGHCVRPCGCVSSRFFPCRSFLQHRQQASALARQAAPGNALSRPLCGPLRVGLGFDQFQQQRSIRPIWGILGHTHV